MAATSTDEGFPIRCEVCGGSAIVDVSCPPGDSVCPTCGSFLWVSALVEMTSVSAFVPDLRIASLEATNRDDAFRETAKFVGDDLGWIPEQQRSFVNALIKRELLGSTEIGRGFAVPHAKVDWVDDPYTAMAFAPAGISFDSVDGKPVHTIITIVAPTSRPGDYLRLLERVVRSLRAIR